MSVLRVQQFVQKQEEILSNSFLTVQHVARQNQRKVLQAFVKEGVSARHFNPSLGYGYGDDGRDMLDRVFASVFGAQDALVRPQFASGTHVLSVCIKALAAKDKTFLSITGQPYDTLHATLGITPHDQSIVAMGAKYQEVALKDDGIDIEGVLRVMDENVNVVFLQRSRGYAWRRSLSIAEIQQAIAAIKAKFPNVLVMVDNCYGEFVETQEPCQVGADLMAGSLIKNPCGGLAPTGGYCAGKSELVERVADTLFAPGIGREVGSYDASYRTFYQGLFLAPHTVAQALCGALLFAQTFRALGFEALPQQRDFGDLVAAIKIGSALGVIAVCEAVQAASPVDAMAVPEAWDMPGYDAPVIMAAGAFVQGSSIELSADAPIRKPYTVYVQGGLTLDHVVIALEGVLEKLEAQGIIRIPE